MTDDPFRRLTELWQQSALAAAQAGVEAAGRVAQVTAPGLAALGSLWQETAGGDPAAWVAAWTQRVAAVTGRTPPSAAVAPDPERLNALWAAAMPELQAEIGALPDGAFTIDWAPLAASWAAVAAGTADDRQRGAVSRFLQALSVKARLGGEYFVDPDAVEVAPTPRHKVAGLGRWDLFRYEPPGPRRGPPVLIVYSVINRSYILDLTADNSFIAHLLGRGADVFLIEWNGAEPGDHATTLDDVVERGVHGAVQSIRAITGARQVSVLGHCLGGTFAAMHAARHPQQVARFVALTTPLRRPASGVVAMAVDRAVFDVDRVVRQHGQMPAKLIRWTFLGLKPWHEAIKWKMFVDGLHDDGAWRRFCAIDRWANDNPDIPAEVFRRLIELVFQSDALAAGRATVDGASVRLDDIACPTLVVTGEADWIVPDDSAAPLRDAPAAQSLVLPGGHLSLILDPRLRDRWDTLADFLLAT